MVIKRAIDLKPKYTECSNFVKYVDGLIEKGEPNKGATVVSIHICSIF